MRWILAACLSVALPGLTYGAAVPIVFEFPADNNPSNVFVQFLTSSTEFKAMYRDAAGNPVSLSKSTAYSMATLTSPISVGGGAPSNKPAILVSNFISGRVYFNFGNSGLSGMSDIYIPGAQNPLDPNYYVRYGYIEPTVINGKITANLTYIDFVGLSISLVASNAPHAGNSPQLSAYGKELVDAVWAASTTPGSNVLPSASAMLPGTNFARVIAPQLRGDLYPGWTNYLRVFLQGKTNTIKGLFGGVGSQPAPTSVWQRQTYEFKVTFSTNGDALMVATTNSGDGYTHIYPVNRGPGVGPSNTISITFAVLNSINGIYGNNPSYTVVNNGSTTVTAGIVNDYYGWVVGDLMAGLSFGFLSSTVDFKGKAIGEYCSAEWWGAYIEDGVKIAFSNSPAGNGLYFGKAQPDQPHNYHSFAAALEPLTTGYGFALQDRLGNNLLDMDTTVDAGSYLVIHLNPDYNPQPGLTIRSLPADVVLRWPAVYSNFALMNNTDLRTTNWNPVGIAPSVENTDLVVTSPATGATRFYRLRK
jgi:hypothetical protein